MVPRIGTDADAAGAVRSAAGCWREGAASLLPNRTFRRSALGASTQSLGGFDAESATPALKAATSSLDPKSSLRSECMVIEKHISNFHATYDELTQEVLLAANSFVAERLQEWFAHLDGESEAAAAIEKLQAGQNFSQWFAMQGRRPQPGAPKLEWPSENEKRLGMQLLMFRSMARGDVNAGLLGKMYIPGSGQNINDNSRAFIEQVFRPMSRALIRYLRLIGEAKAEKVAPAADRVVSLDHNSKAFIDALAAADHVEKALSEANDFADSEEKEQRIAEVSAVRRLLKAIRVRVEPIIAILKPLAEQAKTKLKDTVVGMAVSKFLALLGALISYIWSVL
jgi:hypothetical protein